MHHFKNSAWLHLKLRQISAVRVECLSSCRIRIGCRPPAPTLPNMPSSKKLARPYTLAAAPKLRRCVERDAAIPCSLPCSFLPWPRTSRGHGRELQTCHGPTQGKRLRAPWPGASLQQRGVPKRTFSCSKAHCPDPTAERQSVKLASSKYIDTSTKTSLRPRDSTNLEYRLKLVTARGSPNRRPA